MDAAKASARTSGQLPLSIESLVISSSTNARIWLSGVQSDSEILRPRSEHSGETLARPQPRQPKAGEV